MYLFDETGTRARLISRSGFAADHPAAPAVLEAGAPDAPWPLIGGGEGDATVVGLASRFPALPTGPWSRPPAEALVLPMAQQGQKRAAGIFVAGLNPFRQIDESVRSFVGLLVGQIASGLANVHAYEEERRRAQALAELDRAKTMFFSNVSHEFRTPLTLLLGPLDEARRAGEVLPAEVRQQLDVAHRNSLRLLKLVNTLLDFTRIEAGRVRARFEPVDLGHPHDRSGEQFSVGDGEGRPASSRSRASHSRNRSTSIVRCGKRSSSTSSPTLSSSRSRAR